MARLNRKTSALTETTHEGAPAYGNLSPIQQLRRSVMACFLWEDQFYEDGQSIADRIIAVASKCDPIDVAALAIEARTKGNLRHVPLLLLTVLAKTSSGTGLLSAMMPNVIRRADELAEFLTVYAAHNKIPVKSLHKLSTQVKKGLARSFENFTEYSFAKYNRDADIRLRDVMFLCHPKPLNEERKALYKAIAENTLKMPDTWEVALSGGADKKEAFTRLLTENKLGAFALLRNLRNMEEAGVEKKLIESRLLGTDSVERAHGFNKILPFRYVAAARNCVSFEPMIDEALLMSIEASEPLKGTTVVLVDVSGSMDDRMSGKSELKRIDAAAALASIIKSDELLVYTFSEDIKQVPARRGMAGIDAVIRSQPHGGTDLGGALKVLNEKVRYDRIIVITDEQSATMVPGPKGKGYLINVASNKNGVGYGPWIHIDGFSERVINFIQEFEGSK